MEFNPNIPPKSLEAKLADAPLLETVLHVIALNASGDIARVAFQAQLSPAERAALGETRQVVGYSVAGHPDSSTQAQIDVLVALGWPEWAIIWRYLGEAGGATPISATCEVPAFSLGLTLGVVSASGQQIAPNSAVCSVPSFALGLALGAVNVTGVQRQSAVCTVPAFNLGLALGAVAVSAAQGAGAVSATCAVPGFGFNLALGSVGATGIQRVSAVATAPAFGLGLALGAVSASGVQRQIAVATVPAFGLGLALGAVSVTGVQNSTAPASPHTPSLSTTSGSITVTWTGVSGATSYNIYYRVGADPVIGGGGTTKVTGTTSPQALTLADDGTTWHIAVTAQNASGESSLSGVASAKASVIAHIIDFESGVSGSNVTDSQGTVWLMQQLGSGSMLSVNTSTSHSSSHSLNGTIGNDPIDDGEGGYTYEAAPISVQTSVFPAFATGTQFAVWYRLGGSQEAGIFVAYDGNLYPFAAIVRDYGAWRSTTFTATVPFAGGPLSILVDGDYGNGVTTAFAVDNISVTLN